MGDIKSVVGSLCKIVNYFSNTNLKPEHFRLAKYDKANDNVVPLFWKLLNCYSKTNTDNIVLNVKLHFAGLLYKNADFYALPDDMSAGSQELLLAFSWLLCKKKILESLLKTELSKSEISKEFHLNIRGNYKRRNSGQSMDTSKDFMNYILWISGQINDNLKRINEYRDKTLELMSQVHKDTLSSKNTFHLSTTETSLIKHKEELKFYVNKLENVSQLLDNYFKWKTKEKSYWEWMATVLKEKTQNQKNYINKEILEQFFTDIRNHVKERLTTNSSNVELQYKNEFPRYIYAPQYKEELSSGDKNLEQISNENERNILAVQEFLDTFLQ